MTTTYLFHPSSLYLVMPDPKDMDLSQLTPAELEIWRKTKRTTAEQEQIEFARARMLSEGAKTAIKALARDEMFKVRRDLGTREIRKGRECEQDSIDLYNTVTFQSLEKNTERRSNEYLTGECDLWIPGEATMDAKTAWSIETFPLLSEDVHCAAYEWQGRGYMMLWDVPRHEVFYSLVDTPDGLIPRSENIDMHKVSHIDPKLRITRYTYQRDEALEEKIKIKVAAAQKYMAVVMAQARNEKGIAADWRKFAK